MKSFIVKKGPYTFIIISNKDQECTVNIADENGEQSGIDLNGVFYSVEDAYEAIDAFLNTPVNFKGVPVSL